MLKYMIFLLALFYVIVHSQGVLNPYNQVNQQYGNTTLEKWDNSYYIWNCPPTGALEANEELYRKLEADKEQVSASIINGLKLKAIRINSNHYSSIVSWGELLWKFGPKYIMKLEPYILQSNDEEIRIYGTQILMWPKSKVTPDVEALALKVLKRDSSMKVKANIIRALGYYNSVTSASDVSVYLKSEDDNVRKNAVTFFWDIRNVKPEPAMIEMINTEKNYDIGFWLSWTLCRNNYTTRMNLLTSKESGIRAGILYYLGDVLTKATDDEMNNVVENINTENDLVCQFEMANVLLKNGDIRCIPLLISILKSKDNPNHPYHNLDLKTSTSTKLSCILNFNNSVTDDERKQGKEMYAGLAKRYSEWYELNKDKIHWYQDDREFR